MEEFTTMKYLAVSCLLLIVLPLTSCGFDSAAVAQVPMRPVAPVGRFTHLTTSAIGFDTKTGQDCTTRQLLNTETNLLPLFNSLPTCKELLETQ